MSLDLCPNSAPQDLVATLSQTLQHLSAAGPERDAADAFLHQALGETPGAVLVALVAIAGGHQEESIRTLALILLRRLAFRSVAPAEPNSPLGRDTWDVVDDATRSNVQRSILELLANAGTKRETERGMLCDAISKVASSGLDRGITWPELPQLLSQLFSSPALVLREAVFRIYAECISLLRLEQPGSVASGLEGGLKDESPGVRLAALKAAVNLIATVAEAGENLEPYARLGGPMLDILPPLAAAQSEARLTSALLLLIELASTPKVPSRLFKPHLPSILSFSLSIVTPSPFSISPNHSDKAFEDSVRESAIELLISIAENAPSMCKSYVEYSHKLVPALLNAMSEVPSDDDWYKATAFDDDDDDAVYVVAEQALDRLAQALGEAVFVPFVQTVQSLLTSEHWEHRHAALSGFSAVAEGCADKMINQMSYIVNILLKSIKDPHPRVQYASIYAIGQLSVDLEGDLQADHGAPILAALLSVTHSRHARVQAYSCAALVNFFQDADMDTLELDTLQNVFQELVRVLSSGEIFVKEHAMEAVTILASSMETGFSQFYPQVMPQLLDLLEAGNDSPLVSLRGRALDCASTIGSNVDSSIFAPDAPRLLLALHNIRATLDPEDSETARHLLTAFALLAGTVGPELFGPYLPDVLPQLLEVASRKPEISVTSATDGAEEEEDDGLYDHLAVNGDVVAIKASDMEEKNEAISGLVMLVQAVGTSLPLETLNGVLQLAIPLLKFYFHVGVRESSSALVSVVVEALSKMSLSPDQRTALLTAVTDAFAANIAADKDADLLADFCASWSLCCTALPSHLTPAARDPLLKAFEAQLTSVLQREKEREAKNGQEDDDDDDEIEYADMAESDAGLLTAINRALELLLKQETTSFPIGPFLPFLGMVNSSRTVSQHFALRLLCDIIQLTGDASLPLVQAHLPRVLGLLHSEQLVTRKIAAFIVGVAAESASVAYADFAIAAIEPLFATTSVIDMEDPALMAARDNAVSALGKIIRHLGDKVDAERLLPRWVAALPIFQDADEMGPTYSMLLELISRSHPSVSPTSDPAQHVIKVLVVALESEDLPPVLQRPVAEALKTYISSVPNGSAIELPAHVQAKAEALLS